MRPAAPAIDGYGLGLQGWQQPIAAAPGVVDGIHLRWSFSTSRGLPWYGYWVLRAVRDRVAGRQPQSGTMSPLGGPSHHGLQVGAGGRGATNGSATLGRGIVGRTREQQGVRAGILGRPWQQLGVLGEGPIGLPVSHPAYPLSAGAMLGVPLDAALAKSRIRYGDVEQPFTPDANGSTGFAELRELLSLLVAGGPDGPRMASVELPPEPEQVEQVATSQPHTSLRGRPVLDWLALASVEPAVAQMLGLYVVDTDVTPGQSFDYLIMADFNGAIAAAGNPQTWAQASSAWQSGRWEREGVHVCLLENLQLQPQPALGAPRDVWGCPLRGEMRAEPGSLREMQDATRVIGVRWQAQQPKLLAGGAKVFDAPMERYHVWRGACGPVSGPVPAGGWSPLVEGGAGPATTLPTPLLAVDGPGRAEARGNGAIALPLPRMMVRDVLAQDGFYAYRVARSDIFGRFSAPSKQASWRPLPDDGLGPRFWDEVPAPGGVLDAQAIEVRSELPPPPPQGMVATLHDPADPFDVSHRSPADYETWLMQEQDVPPQRAKELAAELAASPYWQWRSSLAGTPPELVLEVRWSWSWPSSKRTPGVRGFRVELEHKVDGKPSKSLLAEVPFHAAAKSGWPEPTQGFEVRRDGAGGAASGVGVGLQAGEPAALRLIGAEFDLAALRPGVDQVLLEGDSGPDGPLYVLRDVRAVVDEVGAVAKVQRWLLLDGAPVLADLATVKWAIGEAVLEWRVFLPVDGLFAFADWRAMRVGGRVGVVAVGVQETAPRSAAAGGGFVERVRRVWPADAPELKLVPPAEGLRASPPDAQGRSFVQVPWQLEGVTSLPIRMQASFACVSDLMIYASEAAAQPRSLADVIASDGGLRPELVPTGMVVTAEQVAAVRGFFDGLRAFALTYRVEVGAGLGPMTVAVAREELRVRLAAGTGDGDAAGWWSE
ncbi:MAG: hypothetical protein RIT45_3879, partial [Pseudomonadota bacterium]